MRDRSGAADNRYDPHDGATAPRTFQGIRRHLRSNALSGKELVTGAVTGAFVPGDARPHDSMSCGPYVFECPGHSPSDMDAQGSQGLG